MRAVDLRQVLDLAEHVAAELAAAAVDSAADFSTGEREALVRLALAVEAAAARAVGVLPRTLAAEAVLMRAMLDVMLPEP